MAWMWENDSDTKSVIETDEGFDLLETQDTKGEYFRIGTVPTIEIAKLWLRGKLPKLRWAESDKSRLN